MVTQQPGRDAAATSPTATLGSLAGCLVLYYIGRKGGEALVRKRFTGDKVERAMARLQRYGVMAVLIPSLLPPPAPFKIFVLLAGVAGISAGAVRGGDRHRPRRPLSGVGLLAVQVRRPGDGVHARARHRRCRWSLVGAAGGRLRSAILLWSKAQAAETPIKCSASRDCSS